MGNLLTTRQIYVIRKLDRCSVMQHLGVLERADLLIVRREERHRWNYFNPLPIRELHGKVR
jgi:DNA-binding transcriptional ArsR family regulator